jgi:DNA-binding NtrC family response regulator
MARIQQFEDDFLLHVFPGKSEAAVEFRKEILRLNLYCKRFKGAVNCILLTGETGVGKNYTARGISAHSQWLTLADDERRDLFYEQTGRITIAPAALIDRLLYKEHLPARGRNPQRVPRLSTVLGPQLADELAGSELFGHRKHSFTGAHDDHPGIFGDAAVDDVLLDEIADLSLKVQAKLLQFVETRTFRPIGGLAADESTSEHRIFLATNRPLEDWVREGRFREDLYWRIQGYRIPIPPLRMRRDTVREIAYSVLSSVNQRQRGERTFGPSLDPASEAYCLLPRDEWPGTTPYYSNWVVRLDEEDLHWCESYDWPGNIRELRQRIELYVYRNGHCRLKDLLPVATRPVREEATAEPVADVNSLVLRAVQKYLHDVLRGATAAPLLPKDLLSHFERLVKHAVYQFKSTNRLLPKDLATLFPDARDAETTIGRWRTVGVECDAM